MALKQSYLLTVIFKVIHYGYENSYSVPTKFLLETLNLTLNVSLISDNVPTCSL